MLAAVAQIICQEVLVEVGPEPLIINLQSQVSQTGAVVVEVVIGRHIVSLPQPVALAGLA